MRIIHCAWAAALLSALAAGSCAKDTAGNGGTGTTESYNDKIDSYLAERYLWNGEYGQMTRDLTIEYAADKDNFLTRTLLGMTSNTLDKKRYTDGAGQNYYNLYSYITRKARSRAATGLKTRGVNHGVRKETEYGFGFARLGVVRFSNTGKAGFYVMAVYPGSPADKAGFRRGTIFSEIDGAEIADSESEYTPVYKRLTSPSGAASVLFKVRETGEETTLTAERLYPNPVLRAEVIEEGKHKIGYMVYNGFDAAYDDDLLDSLRKFRDAGITDLVLDLRYNGGGHVISAKMLATCIAGEKCDGKVFQYYRYNDSRMADPAKTQKQTGNTYDREKALFLREFQLRRLLRGGPQAVRPRPAEHLCADDRQHGVVERSGHQRVEGNRHRRDADRREDQRQERGHGDRQVRRRRLFVRTGPDHVRRLQRQKGDGESGRTRGRLCGRRLEQQTGGFRT